MGTTVSDFAFSPFPSPATRYQPGAALSQAGLAWLSYSDSLPPLGSQADQAERSKDAVGRDGLKVLWTQSIQVTDK